MDATPKTESLETAPNKSATAANDASYAKRMLTAVNFFVETNRLEPYTAVYLIQNKGWNEVHFGVVSMVMNVASVVFQTPAGDLLDKTQEKKKLVTVLAILVAAITTVLPVWTSNFWAILVGKTFEGISATVFLPALMALLLGICQTESEVNPFIAVTEVSNKIGSCLFVTACALITYFAFPNVESMFYLLGSGGLAAAVFTFLIPEKSIDHDRARQLGGGGDPETSDDDDEEEVEETHDDIENQENNKKEKKSKAKPSRYLDLLKTPSIIFFALLTFFYHLANAGVVPLLAQYVATVSSERTSLTWTSALLLFFYFFQAITSYIMSFAVDRFQHKNIMMVAFLALPIRCAAIALLITYWNNPWGLTATQVFDGIGAGVYDIMLPIIVKKLTKGSGRFGFAYGFIITCWRIGHGVSILFGEAIVHSFGYTAVFITMGGLGLVNLLGFAMFFNFDAADDEINADSAELPHSETMDGSEDLVTASSTSKDYFSMRRRVILETISKLREDINDATEEESKKLQQDLEIQVQQLRDLNQQEQETSSNSTRSSSPLEAVLEDPEDVE